MILVGVFQHLLVIFLLGISSYPALASEGIPLLFWTNVENLNCSPNVQGPSESISSIFSQTFVECLEKGKPQEIFIFLHEKLHAEDFLLYGQPQHGDIDVFANVKNYMERYPSFSVSSVRPDGLLEDLVSRLSEIVDQRKIQIIKLPPGQSVQEWLQRDRKIRSVLQQKTSYIALVTSENSLGEGEKQQLWKGVGRHLLAADDVDQNNTLTYLIENCVYMVYSDLSITVTKRNTNNAPIYTGSLVPLTNSITNKSEEDRCAKLINRTGEVGFQKHFVGDVMSEKYPGLHLDVHISMKFNRSFYPISGMMWWHLKEVVVSFTSNDTSSLPPDVAKLNPFFYDYDVSAPNHMSYACASNPPMTYYDYGKSSNNNTVTLVWKGWQVQPYGTSGHNFTTAVDCVGWFSGPIWSGLLGTLLLLILLCYGLSMLAAVTTMDRFDDPKGKTLAINLQETN